MALEFPVVGVGSSAGGISALLSLLKEMRTKPGLAIVVVQHLSPTHVSRLVWMLRDATQLTVREAVDGMVLERDHVYVIAPGQVLTMAHGKLVSRPRQGPMESGIDTVDRFFESLAADQGPNAIGVVLSGAGSDGAAGAIHIKMAGGRVFVQDPATAAYDSMPRAARATGAVNAALSLGALARELCIGESSSAIAPEDSQWTQETKQALEKIRQLVRAHAGIDLAGYKSTPLLSRIRRRLEFRRISSIAAYAAFLAGNPAELEALVRGVPIHVTSFFRDPEVWEFLAETVVAPLMASRRDGPPIRAWTAACSSGEEAYSLAILLSEQASRVEQPPEFQVFGTDASADIVARAGRGWFPASAVAGLSPERRERFFEAVEGGYRVQKELRSKLVFARHDLLTDPPFPNLDVLTCRNLLIYMDTEGQEQVLGLLSSALGSGGMLLLGSGEALDLARHGFTTSSHRHRLYRKIDASTASAAHLIPPPAAVASAERAHLALLAEREQAGVLVDAELSVLHVYGDMDPFLRVPSGELASNLSLLARPGLAPHVSFAVQEALDERVPVTTRRVWESPRGPVLLTTRVSPVDVEGKLRLLVSFLPEPGTLADTLSRDAAAEDLAISERASDEGLRLSTEELQASREELHAVNEELRAVNDQLSIVNERLATSNEQLNGANEQLRIKIDELETQGSVLSSGAVMTLFLDEHLSVRWFTPAIRAIFPLVPADVGRPISDIVSRIDDPGFLDEVRNVIACGEASEGEFRSHSGQWYLRRIGVHGRAAGRPRGVVVTFTDVSARHEVEAVLRASEERQSFLLKLSDILQRLEEPNEIKAAAMHMLGKHLRVSRAQYHEVDSSGVFYGADGIGYADGLPLLDLKYRIGQFGSFVAEDFEAGRPFRSDDLLVDPRPTDEERAAYGTYQIRAGAGIPLLRGGKLVAILAVHDMHPHAWTDLEMDLIRETAERIWVAVEKVRTEIALRESGQRQAFLLKLSDDFQAQETAEAIGVLATRSVAEHMRVDRSWILRLSEQHERAWIAPEFCAPGLPSLAGEYRYSDFPEAMKRAAPEPLVIRDSMNDESLTHADKQFMYERLGLRAVLAAVPRKGERNARWSLAAATSGRAIGLMAKSSFSKTSRNARGQRCKGRGWRPRCARVRSASDSSPARPLPVSGSGTPRRWTWNSPARRSAQSTELSLTPCSAR